jgi:hypothetical protein
MPNPYITNVNPYFAQQDQQGLSPVFQNIGQQQANQNAALAEQNQQVMQAGQTQQGGMNPMAMAMALRKKGNGITEKATGLGYDQNGQNPYAYTPQQPDYTNVGNLFSTRD